MRYAYRTALEKSLQKNPNEYSVAKLITQDVEPAVQKVVETKLHDFGAGARLACSGLPDMAQYKHKHLQKGWTKWRDKLTC